MKERQIEPDFLKGLCIFLMVYGHIIHVGDMHALQESLTRFIYTFHMPLFLLVSGFFFSFTHEVGTKALKIVRQILVPYLFFITLYILGLIITSRIGIPTQNIPPATLIGFIETITIKPSGSYWFLHSLLIIQLSILFASYATSTNKNNRTLLIFLLSFIFFIFWSQIHIVSIRISIYFLLGILLGIQTKRKISIPVFPLLIASIAILILSSFVSDGIYHHNSKHQYVWCLVLFSLLWSVSQRYKSSYIVNIFAWLGKNSLSILVLHAFFVVSMKSTHKIFLSIDSTGLLYSIFSTFFAVAGCLLLSHIFDKLRISQFLFGVPKIYSPRQKQ